MERGLRQEDPITPFLFIIVAESLKVVFKEATRKNLFRGMNLPGSNAEVSLLQYVDDAIITGEWDPCNAKNLVQILKRFELCSGLKVN